MQIDEAKPENVRIPANEDTVAFYNPSSGPLDVLKLRQAILVQENRNNIRCVKTYYDSLVESAWFLPLFPNAETVQIQNKPFISLDEIVNCATLKWVRLYLSKGSALSFKALPRMLAQKLAIGLRSQEDASILGECVQLTALDILYWPHTDLKGLSSLHLNTIFVSQGKVVSTGGLYCARMECVTLFGCRYIENLDGLKTPILVINMCNRLNLDSIARVQGLKRLVLNEQRSVSTLEFLNGCDKLEDLRIISNIKTHDLMPLQDLKSLRIAELWVGRQTNEQVVKLSQLNKDLLISNKAIYCHSGKQIPLEEFRKKVWDRRGGVIL